MLLVCGGHGYGIRNSEGTRVFKLCAAADLVTTNTYFIKCDSHLLTYSSGNACSKIDNILVWKRDFKSVRDVKVTESERCVLQHKLLVGDLELNTTFSKSRSIPPKQKLSELSDQGICLVWKLCSWEGSSFKIHIILTELGTTSKLACLILVILFVVGHSVVIVEERKHGGEMM